MNQTAAKQSIQHHPLVFSILIVVTDLAVGWLMKKTADLVSVDLSVLATGIISGAVLSALAAVVLSRLGAWRQLGLVGRPQRWRSLLWLLPFLINGLLPLTAAADVSPGKAAGAVFFGVLIAFWKLAALGLILFTWLPRGPRTAAAMTALFFGGMHLGGILTGAIVTPTLLLALSYCFLAFAFVAVRLRTGLLWPLVATYSLFLTSVAAVLTSDASNLAASVADVLPALGSSVVLAAYGLVAWPRTSQRSRKPDAEPHVGIEPTSTASPRA